MKKNEKLQNKNEKNEKRKNCKTKMKKTKKGKIAKKNNILFTIYFFRKIDAIF